MKRAVIFDVDGTLVDSVGLHAEAWRLVLARHGHALTHETLRAQIGKGGDQLMPEFLSREEVERDGAAIEAERSALFKQDFLGKVRPFPHVAALFHVLRARAVRLSLGSSGKEEEIEHYRGLLGIDDMEMVVTSSADAERSKPYPDIFQAALKRLGVDASEAVAIGDSPYDAEAARRAGITPVGVLCGGFDGAGLRRAGCVAVYGGPEALLRHVDEILAL